MYLNLVTMDLNSLFETATDKSQAPCKPENKMWSSCYQRLKVKEEANT